MKDNNLGPLSYGMFWRDCFNLEDIFYDDDSSIHFILGKNNL